MEFDREVFDLMPSGSKTFNLIGLKMPSDKDIFFRAKQKETLDKYQAARRFMYELETDDWDHYFHKLEDENGNIYFQNVLKAQWYEAALLFYNAVVDLSWIACYISAEYFIYVDGKPVEVEGLTPIEEAYNALRKAEGYVQHPGVDGNPFEYLRKMCPQFSDTLDFVIAFWKDFADTPVRWKYNYLKHKGSLNTTRVSNFFIEIRVVSYLESLAIQGFPFFCVWLMCIGKHQNCEDVFIRRHRYMNTAFRYSYFDMLLQTLAVSCISAFDGGELIIKTDILIHALPKMPFRSVFTPVGLLFFKCGKECFCDRIIERCAAC